MGTIYATQEEYDAFDPEDVRAAEAAGERIVVVGDVAEAQRRSLEEVLGEERVARPGAASAAAAGLERELEAERRALADTIARLQAELGASARSGEVVWAAGGPRSPTGQADVVGDGTVRFYYDAATDRVVATALPARGRAAATDDG